MALFKTNETVLMHRMKAKFQFKLAFDIGESYLYGTAKSDEKTFSINLQGGNASIVLPGDLLAGLPYVNKARLNIRTETEIIILDAKLSSGRDIIEIYDDMLLQKLAAARDVTLDIEVN
jgi:hypothetical protein